MGFPSSENRCFHSTHPKSPNLSHQQNFCLLRSYEECKFYQINDVKAMPPEIATPTRMGKPIKTVIILICLLVIAGAALMGTMGWKNFISSLFPSLSESPVGIPSASPATVPAVSVLETSVSASEVTLHSTHTPTPAWNAAGTSTARPGDILTPLPYPHGFEVTKVPPGGNQGYLVHIVAVGETLDMIADRYDTTVQAIMAVNYGLKPPVWVQYPIVIPVNTKDAAGLPAFKVYVVEAYESISAKSLADVLGVDASALEFYNLCTANCQFNKGDVLLVPFTQLDN